MAILEVLMAEFGLDRNQNLMKIDDMRLYQRRHPRPLKSIGIIYEIKLPKGAKL